MSSLSIAAVAGKLLPDTIDDFRTQTFWRGFFEAQRGKPFEWYATWAAFARNFKLLCPNLQARILVLGCGNSAMSGQMHAAGFTNITNVDFDAGVIAEMSAKHSAAASMRWLVADVTAMSIFEDGSFDVVLDKGTIDAMLTSDDAAVTDGVDAMLREVQRVIAPGGLYVVVTLAQSHLLRHWLARIAAAGGGHGGGGGWADLHVDTLAVPDMASPHCQFFLSVRKVASLFSDDGTGAASSASSPVHVTLHLPNSYEHDEASVSGGGKGKQAKTSVLPAPLSPLSPPAASWQSAHEAGEESRAFALPTAAGAAATAAAAAALAAATVTVAEAVDEARAGFDTARQLLSVHPDHYLVLDVWAPEPPLPGSAATGASKAFGSSSGSNSSNRVVITRAGAAGGRRPADAASTPRFTVSVLDVSLAPSAAVVLVPLGREHEWLFASRDGQRSVAQSARAYGRLLFVALNRGHAFPGGVAGVQAELSPIVAQMLPAELRGGRGGGGGGKGRARKGPTGPPIPVPFLAVADDLGARETVATGRSALSGEYVVEDVKVDGDDDDDGSDSETAVAASAASFKGEAPQKRARPAMRRRLVFLSNRNAVQSEARLLVPAPAATAAPAAVDLSTLCFEYQQAVAAMIRLYCSTAAAATAKPNGPSGGEEVEREGTGDDLRVCVVGLGGGALVAFLASLPPAAVASASGGAFARMRVTAVELDPEVVALSRAHFALPLPPGGSDGDAAAAAAAVPSGGKPQPLSVVVGDGLAFMRDRAEAAAAAAGASGAAASSGTPAFHVLVVDVDAKDLGTAVSFPPLAFLGRTALQHMQTLVAPAPPPPHALLLPEGSVPQVAADPATAAASSAAALASAAVGLVVINFACRSAPMKAAVVASLQRQFLSAAAASAAPSSASASASGAPSAAAASGAGSGVLEVGLEDQAVDGMARTTTNSLLVVAGSPQLERDLLRAAGAPAGVSSVPPAAVASRPERAWRRYAAEWSPHLRPAA